MMTQSEKDDSKLALKNAQDAADAGDNIGMVRYLFNSMLLEGYVIYFKSTYPNVTSEDIHHIIAGVIDAISAKIRNGEKVRAIGGYISKVVDCRLIDFVNNKGLHIDYDVENIGALKSLDSLENDMLQEKMYNKWKELFVIVEGLIPRLNIGHVQDVMKYIFGAVKNGSVYISNQEIADALDLPITNISQYKKRGFERLARIAKEENLVDVSFSFSFLEKSDYYLEKDIQINIDNNEFDN